MIDNILNISNEIRVIDGGAVLGSRTMILSSDLFKMLRDDDSNEVENNTTAAYEKVKRTFDRVGE